MIDFCMPICSVDIFFQFQFVLAICNLVSIRSDTFFNINIQVLTFIQFVLIFSKTLDHFLMAWLFVTLWIKLADKIAKIKIYEWKFCNISKIISDKIQIKILSFHLCQLFRNTKTCPSHINHPQSTPKVITDSNHKFMRTAFPVSIHVHTSIEVTRLKIHRRFTKT